MFVREADEAVLLGPDDPDYLGPSPYLDYAELRRALSVARADAVWPGWGFVSEKSDFARLCRDMDIVFVGPSPEVMERLGDKIASKLLAEEVGVPMAAWSNGPVADLAAAREHADRIGYPLMVKATAGGGGRGIRKVERPEDLAEAFERASSEGAKTAGDGTVFLERAIAGGRHVEVQVVADATGDVWTLGVRDCSVQRRNQKVIEESASTALYADQEQLLRSSAAALVKAAGYVNAGTVEFLYEPERAPAVVPGGQHPPAGGALRHRGDHRRRHRQAAAARGGRRQAGGDRAGDACRRAGTRSRPGSPRRTPSRASPPRPATSSTWTCPQGRACASTPAWRRATRSRRSSTP